MSDSTRKRGPQEKTGDSPALIRQSFDANTDEEELKAPYFNADLDDDAVPIEESHTRSLLKGLTWRFVATMTTVVIAYFVTGTVSVAFEIGFFEFFAKIGIYYIHERIWARIRI